MSEKGAGYFAAAQRTEKSREELKEEIQDLRERADLSDEEMESVLESL
jgi:CBS-domain-containing membrane protein